MLNKIIIETFEKIADEHGLSEISKKQIIDYLNKRATGQSSGLEDEIANIFESLGKKYGD